MRNSSFKKPALAAVAFFGTLGILSTGYSAYTALSNVTAGSSQLKASDWNAMIADLDDHQQKLSNVYFTAGKIGIGTATPSTTFVVRSTQPQSAPHPYRAGISAEGEGSDIGARVSTSYAWSLDSPIFLAYRSRGTLASPAAVTGGDYLASFLGFGYDGSGWQAGGNGGINVISTEPHTTTGHGTALSFLTTANGAVALGEKMKLDHNGYLGIGTSSPASPLTVENSNDGIVTYKTTDNTWLYTQYVQANGTRRAWMGLDGTLANFTLGLENGTSTFSVLGNMIVSGTVTQNSDERLKTGIRPLENSLEKLSRINGVRYFWKDPKKDSSEQIGVIAQDVEKEFPELVKTDGNGIKSVEYANLVSPLIEAVKELKKDSERKDSEIADLKARLERLEK